MPHCYFHDHIDRLPQPDVQVVLLHPDLNGLADLSSIDLTTFRRDAVDTQSLQS